MIYFYLRTPRSDELTYKSDVACSTHATFKVGRLRGSFNEAVITPLPGLQTLNQSFTRLREIFLSCTAHIIG